jgi:hypothetical protein
MQRFTYFILLYQSGTGRPAPFRGRDESAVPCLGRVKGEPCGGYFVHPFAKWMILLLISAFSRNCAYTDEGMQEHFVG